MASYILRRLGLIFIILLLASIIIFVITQMLPGDIAQVILGQFATETAIENLREELGLNRPMYIQYFDWMVNFFTGNWGDSLTFRTPVYPIVMQRLMNSAMLAVVAFMIYVPLGIFFGVIAALKRDKTLDICISSSAMVFAGLPEFITGMILINVFAIGLGWLPGNSSIDPGSTFSEAFPYLILPALTASLTGIAYVTRMTRSGTIDVLKKDYIRSADLKGLPRLEVIVNHVLRNSLVPTVTVIALGIGWLIGGLIVTEHVFGYPGLGRLLLSSIMRQDLTMIQAISMIIVATFSFANLAADIIYGLLNPKIRLGS